VKWQTPVRWLVAIAGVGTAVALYTQTRERPAESRPAVATPADPEASVQSGAGTSVRFNAGEVEFEITHAGERIYEDGRKAWDKARFRVSDGTYLAADLIETRGDDGAGMPGEMTLTGNVQLDTPEGASIRAANATYAGASGVAILPGPVTFTRGRISGGGTGGEYRRETGVFHILADARVETAADEKGGKVQASASSMTFNRATLALLLDQNATIAHERQTMTADRATLYMAADQDQFKVIELRGRARVLPVPGQASEMPEMQARDIDLAFHDGTQALERAVLSGGSSMILMDAGSRRSIEAINISLATAPDGRTVTHLEAHQGVIVRTPAQAKTAARTITSSELVADGTGGAGLTSALFTGGVRFVEIAPAAAGRSASERVGTSQTLRLGLGGSLDAVQQAEFQQNVRFEDGDVRGDADLGDYDASAGRLTLRPARVPSRLPRVTSNRVTVDARELIEIDLTTQDLHARGEVKTVNAADNTPAATRKPDTGLFNDRETMLGFGAEFWYTDRDGRARYAGTAQVPARVTQGDTVVIGDAIDLARDTQDLTARGRVDATFAAAAAKAGAPIEKYRVLSDTLEYRDAARAATYVGTPVVLTAPDGVTRARTVVMTLAAQGRGLDRLEARTDVHTTLTEGREARADSLLYEAGVGRYTLRGQPLVLKGPGDVAGTCSQAWARAAHFASGGGAPVFPANENQGGVERREVSCSAPLQK
jgi:lipopolysaccharide export system protein LptA